MLRLLTDSGQKLLASLRVLLVVARKTSSDDIQDIVAAPSCKRDRMVLARRLFGEGAVTVQTSEILFTKHPEPLRKGVVPGCFLPLRATAIRCGSVLRGMFFSPSNLIGIPLVSVCITPMIDSDKIRGRMFRAVSSSCFVPGFTGTRDRCIPISPVFVPARVAVAACLRWIEDCFTSVTLEVEA